MSMGLKVLSSWKNKGSALLREAIEINECITWKYHFLWDLAVSLKYEWK